MNAIFDVGGVIIEWKPDEILAKLFPDDAARRNFKKNAFAHPDWTEMDGGTLTEEDAVGRFSERTGMAVHEIENILERTKAFLTLKQDTFDLLKELREKGVALYCLSNMPSENYEFFKEKYSLFDIFDGTVISSHVKMLKPDPAIFEYIIETYGLEPADTVFVDDTGANVAAAKKLGFMTVLFDNAENCRKKLHELGVI
ncbi:MAG: HAD family phosphatase [bacterium]